MVSRTADIYMFEKIEMRSAALDVSARVSSGIACWRLLTNYLNDVIILVCHLDEGACDA